MFYGTFGCESQELQGESQKAATPRHFRPVKLGETVNNSLLEVARLELSALPSI